MDILIMGEESQEICKAFRAKGHNAFSCDLLPCSGGHPEWHLQMDMFEAFNSKQWDMCICHPLCTFMCNSSALRLYKNGKKINGRCYERWGKMVSSTQQFIKLLNLPIDKLVIENPIMHSHAAELINTPWSQTIQPYEYGHPETKRTCLWIKGLPLLKPTNVLPKPSTGLWNNQSPSGNNNLGKGCGKKRSKTYSGWAKAMAEQWG